MIVKVIISNSSVMESIKICQDLFRLLSGVVFKIFNNLSHLVGSEFMCWLIWIYMTLHINCFDFFLKINLICKFIVSVKQIQINLL